MVFLVANKFMFCYKPHTALNALKVFLAVMSFRVVGQVAGLFVFVVTKCARIRKFVAMYVLLMPVECTFISTSEVAEFTFVRLFASLAAHMDHKTPSITKLLGAPGAYKVFFVTVGSCVGF